MNEQAQKVLTDLLQRAVTGVDKAVEFSQAQMPDVIHQLLVWNFVSSILFQLLAIFFVAFYFWSGRKALNKLMNGLYDDTGDNLCILWLLSGGCASIFLSVGFFFNFDWLKIWLAPKLYLLEYATSLVK